MQTGCATCMARGRTEGSSYVFQSHVLNEWRFYSEFEQSLDVSLSNEITFFDFLQKVLKMWFSEGVKK